MEPEAVLRAVVGTSIAVHTDAMRLSEAITIYLAAGAPFAVSGYLARRKDERRGLRLLKATASGFVWPFAVLRILLIEYGKTQREVKEDRRSQQCEAKFQKAKRNLLAALHGMSELAPNTLDTPYQNLECAACVLRESVETYVGLAPSIEEPNVENAPGESTMELFRIAGYEGNDIAVAARCANRRNVARVKHHHIRARVQMVHAVADISEAVESIRTSMSANGSAERRLRLASKEVFNLLINLLVLMGDEETARKIAELLNPEISRPPRARDKEKREDLSLESGEVPCKVYSTRQSHAPLSNEATMAQG